jgi:hypothetical protein
MDAQVSFSLIALHRPVVLMNRQSLQAAAGELLMQVSLPQILAEFSAARQAAAWKHLSSGDAAKA